MATSTSVWKSSPRTRKKPGPDWTVTDQDRKFQRPIKTATAVQSSVFEIFKNLKTDIRPVLTGPNRSFQLILGMILVVILFKFSY